MSDFQDKKGRLIEIEVSDTDAIAKHNGRIVGDVQTTGLREYDERVAPAPAKITAWNVEKNYQRAGIALEMVRQLVSELGMLAPADINQGIGGQNTLTDEGMELTIRCQEEGLIYPFPSERPDFEDTYQDED